MKTLRKEDYRERLIDKRISDYLTVIGAVNITGPKWCGKTWTGLNHAGSVFYLDDKKVRELIEINPYEILDGDSPILLDEWSIIPSLWDVVRRKCDEDGKKGKFILTCSTELTNKEKVKEIFHSGVGRIVDVEMHSMSLYESGDSSGKASISSMRKGEQKSALDRDVSLSDLAFYIIRGGWPGNLGVESGKEGLLPKAYVERLYNSALDNNAVLNKEKVIGILRSLARNESTFASMKKVLNDISEDSTYNEERDVSYKTLLEYVNILEREYVIEDQVSYDQNYRSSLRVGSTPKRHLTDPSLVCAILDLNKEKLFSDLQTFGFLFESLVFHDLRIYMESIGGRVFHFHDNATGAESDAVLEFSDGEFALVEVKLGYNKVEEAKKSLLRVEKLFTKPPMFKMVVVGITNTIIRDKESGIYIVPLTSLKP